MMTLSLETSAFFREEYHTDPLVFLPRFDTERLVEHIIALCPPDGVVADLCCGSGCVGISTMANSSTAHVYAVDINPHATELTRKNAAFNKVQERHTTILSDIADTSWAEGLTFDVIASNPPYVRSSDMATLPDECVLEPTIAFDGGADGMDFYRLILEKYRPFLTPSGRFVFEIGYHQADDIRELAHTHGLKCAVHKDYGGNNRVAVIHNKENAT